jgi:RecA-family ATPase
MSAAYTADTARVSGLDVPFQVTFFRDYAASTKTTEPFTLRSLASRCRTITASRKDGLPWLKCATFGDLRTDKNSLRHDDNVLDITGIEADYDGEQIEVSHAVEKLEKAGILAMVYTSPRHTADAPRWRIICPTSTGLPPEQREKMMGRLNGLFGGIFAGESWTLSQAYYYGSVNHNPSHEVHLVDGSPIDDHDDLDEIWLGKPATTTRTTATGERIAGSVDEAALLADITSGASYHASAIRLLGKWARQGVPYMDARQRLLDAFDVVFPPDRDARWMARRGDVDRCLEDIYGAEARQRDRGLRPDEPPPHPGYDGPGPDDGGNQPQPDPVGAPGRVRRGAARDSSPPPPIKLRVVNPVDLACAIVPRREWIVEDWLPVGCVTANYGDGGTGKTLLAQQLQTSTALGGIWCGRDVLKCRSLALYCEDDEDELHRRQAQICAGYGVGLSDLEPMRWVSGVGQDCALMAFDNDVGYTTPMYEAVKRASIDHGARLLILDTAADLFAGNENDRHQVRRFIGQLNRLAIDINGAVLLNAHPSRTGLSTGNLDGGSTAWSNSVRSRWSLARPALAEGEVEDPDARILTRRKANYARVGEDIALRWSDGVLVPLQGAGGATGQIDRAAAEIVFLDLLAIRWEQGVFVSHNVRSGNYAPRVFGQCAERKGFSGKDFEGAMGRLFDTRRITAENYGRKGDVRQRLTPVTAQGEAPDEG